MRLSVLDMLGFPFKKLTIFTKRRVKWLASFLLGFLAIMGGIYGFVASSEGAPAADHDFFKQVNEEFLVIAHRGGAGIAPENTLAAFEKSRDLGVNVIELDVRSTSDGELVVIHDSTVDRTTNGTGRVSDFTLEELKKLNAGYRWTPDGGITFPFRESGITVPTLKEVLAAFPGMKFNIEPKQATASIISPFCNIIREYRMTGKVVVGSFSQTVLDEFRRECPEVATSGSPTEVGKFLTMQKTGLSESYTPVMHALQVPEYAAVQIITKDFVRAAHERNLKVHVWTVNQTADMQRLIETGVDGIMTDYPDRLLKLINRLPAAR